MISEFVRAPQLELCLPWTSLVFSATIFSQNSSTMTEAGQEALSQMIGIFPRALLLTLTCLTALCKTYVILTCLTDLFTLKIHNS